MSGIKRPAGKDFDPPPIQPKQLHVEPPPLASQGGGGGRETAQQFVLPVRHPLDATRRLSSQGSRIIGIPGILPNVSRQMQSPFGFPSPASASSPLGLPVHSPLSAGGLVGISPILQAPMAPLVRTPHIPTGPPHLGLPGFPSGVVSVVGTPHSQTPPAGVLPLESQFLPPLSHVASSTPLPLIRPGSPRPLLAALGPLAPPPPYPTGHLASVGEQSAEEFTCASPSQFLRSPTSITAIASQPQAVSEDPAASGGNPVKTDATAVAPKKENLPQVIPSLSLSAAPRSHMHTGSRKDHHSIKTKLLKHCKSRLAALKLRYELQLKETFFLERNGNMMDFLQWKRKPNILREQYLKQHDIESTATSPGQPAPKDTLVLSANLKTSGASSAMDSEQPLPETPTLRPSTDTSSSHKHTHKSSKAFGGTTSSRTSHSKSDSSSSTRIQIPLSTVSPSLQVVSPLPVSTVSTPKSATPSSPAKTLQIPSPSLRPTTRAQLQTQASFSSVYETSHEDIVMRARQEAEVMRAIADLRKEGLWSASRLPKVQEQSKKRSLWDYLLEEMQWLATDFANERRWKINAAKKVCMYSTVNYTCIVGSSSTRGSSFFLGKVTALGVLCCFALFVCLTLLASFFLPSHLSFKTCTCTLHLSPPCCDV